MSKIGTQNTSPDHPSRQSATKSFGSRMRRIIRLPARKAAPPPDSLLPGGLKVSAASQQFEAIVEAVREARRQHLPIPLGPTLADFEISPVGDKRWQARLLPLTSERPVQSQTQDQAALARLIYQLLIGSVLPNASDPNDLNQALKNLAEPIWADYAPIYGEVASVIRRGLRNEYFSLSELNGAFGWALYQQGQLLPQSYRHSLANGEHSLTDGVWQPSPLDTSPISRSRPLRITLRRNAWVLIGLITVNLLAILALVGVFSNPELFRSQPVTKVAAGLTATDGVAAFSPSPNPLDNSPRPNVSNPVTETGVGAIQRSADLNQLRTQKFGSPASLQPGQAALWNAPEVHVIGQHWPDSSPGAPLIGVATDDGNYRTYQQNSQIASRSALKDDAIGACWSPDGKRYVALLTSSQLQLNDSARQLSQLIPLPKPPDNTYYPYNQPCRLLVSWSPDSQRVLLFINNNPQVWDFSQPTLKQIQPPAIFPTYVSRFNTLWSPDSTKIGVFINETGSCLTNDLQIFDATTLELLNNVDISNKSGSFTAACSFSAELTAWSPDGRRFAHLISTTDRNNGKDGFLTTTLQIFTLPNQHGDSTNPAPVELAQNTVLGSQPLNNAFDQPPILTWLPDSAKLAVFQSLPVSNTNPGVVTNNVEIFVVGGNDKPFLLTKFNTDNNNFSYMAWHPDGKQLLSADRYGNLCLWQLPELGAEFVPTTFTPSFLRLNGQTTVPTSRTNFRPSWSPDGKYLASINYHGVQFYDAALGETKFKLANKLTSGISYTFMGNGQWSADSQLFAAQVWVAAENDPNRSAYQALLIWKIEPTQASELGAIRLMAADNNFNTSNLPDTWVFDPVKPAIKLITYNSYMVEYDLTKPLPPLAEQSVEQLVVTTTPAAPTTPQASAPNPAYTVVGHFSSKIYAADNLAAWSHKQDMMVINLYRYYSLYKAQQPGQPDDQDGFIIKLANEDSQDTPNILKVLFSPDDKLLAFAYRSGTVRIYSTATGKLISVVTAATALLTAVQFSPKGDWLATTSTDRAVKIWQVSDSTSWKLLQILRGYTSPVQNMTFSPAGNLLLTNSSDGTTLLWRLN